MLPIFIKTVQQSDGQYHYYEYNIEIINHNYFPIKLLARHWKILDTMYGEKEVHGEGVVGQQPILLPNEKFSYQSFVGIKSFVGTMKGEYFFENTILQSPIEAVIPEFLLIYPPFNN